METVGAISGLRDNTKPLNRLGIIILFFTLTAAIGIATPSVCNSNDHAIYSLRGSKFPELFRPLGGPFTSKAKFEMGVMELTGLSHACAQCYGDSYICGYSHCKWDCSSAGNSCDACLLDNECTQKCAQCTGFK